MFMVEGVWGWSLRGLARHTTEAHKIYEAEHREWSTGHIEWQLGKQLWMRSASLYLSI
jgi:hypothetical protein